MNLHLDRDAFQTLLLEESESSKLRANIIEKDYYVTLILEELSRKQSENSLPAYFQGGTASYKALGSIRRFSEDIDLTVSQLEGCTSNRQQQLRVEHAAKRYECLERLKNDPAVVIARET